MVRTGALLAFAFVAGCKQAPPQVVVEDAWYRATLQGQMQASVYLKIRNQGGQADRLLSAQTPRAVMAMIHSSTTESGVVRMRELNDGAAIPAGGELLLKPGGDHIMLTGVRIPLKPGEHFPMTLHFKSSGDRTIDVSVLAPDASGPGPIPR